MHLLTQTMHWSAPDTVINILPFHSEPFLEVFPRFNQYIPCCSVQFVHCIYWLKEKHSALSLKYKVTGVMDIIRREEKQPITPGISMTAIKSSLWHLFILVRYCYWGGSHVIFHAKYPVQQKHTDCGWWESQEILPGCWNWKRLGMLSKKLLCYVCPE